MRPRTTPTPSEEELNELKAPRFWSEEERSWRERQAAKIRERMAAFHEAWRGRTATCFNKLCEEPLKPEARGLVYAGRFYCERCRPKVWHEMADKKVGLYP